MLSKKDIMVIWDNAEEMAQDLDQEPDDIISCVKSMQERLDVIMDLTKNEFTAKEYEEFMLHN